MEARRNKVAAAIFLRRISPSPHTPTRNRSTAFFFNDPATTEFYTLSLHDALPISPPLLLPPLPSRPLPLPPLPFLRVRIGPRRQAGGSRWSRTSSTDTAPSSLDCWSHTGAASRS